MGGKVIVDVSDGIVLSAACNFSHPMQNKIAGVSAAEQPKAPAVPTTFSHNIFTNPNTTFAVV